jgi:transposase
MTLHDIRLSPRELSPPDSEIAMSQITARISESLLAKLDAAAGRLERTRAQVIRQAIEYYLEDLEDLHLGLERLQDPSDVVLDWADVKRDLLSQD